MSHRLQNIDAESAFFGCDNDVNSLDLNTGYDGK
jgi:hypothetical protein